MASISTQDMNKIINEYTQRFNYYLNRMMFRVQNFRQDQFLALGTMGLGLILIIVALLIW